jgi:hypothetical protein
VKRFLSRPHAAPRRRAPRPATSASGPRPRLPQAARAPRRIGIRPCRTSHRTVAGRTPWTVGPLHAVLPAPRTACCPRSGTPRRSSLRLQEGAQPLYKDGTAGIPAGLPCHGRAAPPSRHGRRRASPRPCAFPQPLDLPSTSPRPHRSSKHRALPGTSLLLTEMLAAAAAACPICWPRSPPAYRPPTPAQINPR